MPKPLLHSSILSPSFGAYTIQRKYENRDPLEKNAKNLKLYGVNIGKANLSTPLQVLQEKERSICYIWMFHSGIGRAPIVLYRYGHGGRVGFALESFLQGHCGRKNRIQTNSNVGKIRGILFMGRK